MNFKLTVESLMFYWGVIDIQYYISFGYRTYLFDVLCSILHLQLVNCNSTHSKSSDSFEKTLMLGKIENNRRRRRQGMRWLYRITNSMDMILNKLQKIVKNSFPGMLQSMESQRVGQDLVTEQQQKQLLCLCHRGWFCGEINVEHNTQSK